METKKIILSSSIGYLLVALIWQISGKAYAVGWMPYHPFEDIVLFFARVLVPLSIVILSIVAIRTKLKTNDQRAYWLAWLPAFFCIVNLLLFFAFGNYNMNNWGLLESVLATIVGAWSLTLTVILLVIGAKR